MIGVVNFQTYFDPDFYRWFEFLQKKLRSWKWEISLRKLCAIVLKILMVSHGNFDFPDDKFLLHYIMSVRQLSNAICWESKI